MEHRAEIEQLGIIFEPAPIAGEGAPEEDAAAMVEEQIALGVADQLSCSAGNSAVWNPDPSNDIGNRLAPLLGKAPPVHESAGFKPSVVSSGIAPRGAAARSPGF